MEVTMSGRPEKYALLTKHLKNKAKEFRKSGRTDYPMTFKAIEALGVALPPSAYNHRAWWANNDSNDKKKPWERAHFITKDVDMEKRELKFRYYSSPLPLAAEP